AAFGIKAVSVAGAAAIAFASIAPASAQLATATADAANLLSSCSFPTSAAACGYFEEGKVAGRASVATPGRDGGTSTRLHTEPGDNNVYGSGANERNDISLTQAATNCYQGVDQWYGHSFMFPTDYTPSSGWGTVIFDFHNTTSGPGQANMEIDVGA